MKDVHSKAPLQSKQKATSIKLAWFLVAGTTDVAFLLNIKLLPDKEPVGHCALIGSCFTKTRSNANLANIALKDLQVIDNDALADGHAKVKISNKISSGRIPMRGTDMS